MSSERPPTHELNAVERVKREGRRDMPMGLGSSLIVHGGLALLFAGAAAALIVGSKIQPPKEQPSQIITIETLVHTPQTVAQQQPQPMVRQTLTHPVSQPVQATTSKSSSPNVALMKAQQANPSTQSGSSHLATFAVLQGAAGKHHAKKHSTTQDQTKSAAAQAVTATTGAQSAATSTTIYTAPNNGNSAADDDAAAGGYMSPGRGPVWNEHPPGAPGGGGTDSCTPSRGGFLHRR
jgi:hypothetical protein